MISFSDLPTVNAALNGLSAAFLSLGFIFIRRKNIPAHRLCMTAAFTTSILFLISYLTYHVRIGATRFAGEGLVRTVYYSILISHTTLAVTVVPLALITLSRALKARYDRHRAIARWTLPIWLYVSVTGVVVYVMLYHLFPTKRGA